MNGQRGRVKPAVTASIFLTLILTPSIFSAPRFDLPWSLSFTDFLQRTSPIASSSLSVWPESGATQRIVLVGTREAGEDTAAECVRMPPGPESYKVTYFSWFDPESPLSGQVTLAAHRHEDIGRTVVIRLVRQAAYEEEPFLDRSVEVRHALSEPWTTVGFDLPAVRTSRSSLLTSLAVSNPSTTSELELCASHAAVWPGGGEGAQQYFTNPLEWISADPMSASGRWLALGAFALLIFMATYVGGHLLSILRRTPANFVSVGFIALLVVLAGPAIVEVMSGAGLGDTRYQGITGHPNIMAASAVATLVAIWAWTQRRAVFISCFLIGALLVVATGSRAGLITLLFAGGGLLLLPWLKQRQFGAVAVAVIGFGALATGILTYFEVTRLQTLTLARPQIWSSALDLLIERPLGWGYGMAGPALTSKLGPSSGRTVAHAHNLFLNVGLELGVPALLAMLALTAYLFVRLSRRGNVAGLVVLVAVVLLCLVDVTLIHIWVYVPFLAATASPKLSAGKRPSTNGAK